MRDEEELRGKVESINEHWDNARDIWDHGGSNPQVGAIVKTLEWVLEEDED